MILELLQQDGFEPKKKGHGSEYASPCPACGGRDRFVIRSDKNRYWCRQCNVKGDGIQYLRDFHGMGYREAAEAVGKPVVSLPGKRAPVDRPHQAKPAPTINRTAWRTAANNLVTFARHELKRRPDVLAWLKTDRGITEATAERFHLGWLPDNLYPERAAWGLPEELKEDGTPKKLFIPSGLVIPGPDRIRIRRDDPPKGNRYYVINGSGMAPYGIGRPHETTAVIVEAELDAIVLAQEANRELFILALGSTDTSKEHKASLLEKLSCCPVVLVAFDSDTAGANASPWWLENLHNAFRAPIPPEYGKDITEAFINGMDLNLWLSASMALYCESVSANHWGGGDALNQGPLPVRPPGPLSVHNRISMIGGQMQQIRIKTLNFNDIRNQ